MPRGCLSQVHNTHTRVQKSIRGNPRISADGFPRMDFRLLQVHNGFMYVLTSEGKRLFRDCLLTKRYWAKTFPGVIEQKRLITGDMTANRADPQIYWMNIFIYRSHCIVKHIPWSAGELSPGDGRDTRRRIFSIFSFHSFWNHRRRDSSRTFRKLIHAGTR